jgi:xanthine dehydrogenase accessory factor
MNTILKTLQQAIAEGKQAALCIVTEPRGSTPRKPGSKMVVFGDGSITGSIGGGAVEAEVAEMAREIIRTGKPAKYSYDLDEDLSMHCGGAMEVYIEPLLSRQELLIFGAGHIGKALAGFARELDFSVTLIDPREGIFTREEMGNYHCIARAYADSLNDLVFGNQTYVVIVTPKHDSDEDILARVARKPHAYLGMIGRKNKVEQMRKRFIDNDILTGEELDNVDMPIGIKLKAETPAEIALSIAARLVDVRNA